MTPPPLTPDLPTVLVVDDEVRSQDAIRRTLDEDFRVRGLENLYLCDASVFPTSVHVNPQLTVMGLAQYAAHRILGPPPASAPTGGDRAIIA